MKRFAYIEYLNGDTDVIKADYAVKQNDSSIVTFYEYNEDAVASPVAMFNMNNIVGWGFDDEGELEDEIDYDCIGSYITGISDCWGFFRDKLMNMIKLPRVRTQIEDFFENNNIETVLKYYEEVENED